jgi:NAD+ synthase (glutamine-hydrolysing)
LKQEVAMEIFRLALAQINCTVGDLEGNARKVCQYIEAAKKIGAHLISFPELTLPGYPPEDLLLKSQFIKDNRRSLEKAVKCSQGICAVVGFADSLGDRRITNAAAVIYNGRLVGIYHKIHLPNYGVFDEMRYFQPGAEYPVFVLGGVRIGVSVCEDIWEEKGPAYIQALEGDAEVIVNINASPYHMSKWKEREKLLKVRAIEYHAFVSYNNMVGGQDELVFDGHGMIFDPIGNLIARGKQFEEDLIVVDIDLGKVKQARRGDLLWEEEKEALRVVKGRSREIIISFHPLEAAKKRLPKREVAPFGPAEEVYQALVLGIKDYVRKNGFEKAVIGLSGGIDSALAIAIATDALGTDNVKAVFMPSQYSSKESLEDARKVAENLGLEFIVIPVQDTFESYQKMLSSQFKGLPFDVTEENVQARIRGNTLMALANKFGWLVLATGNKSELAVGYATLYGDMAGGFEVIKDVPKTLVYKLVEYRNSISQAIPRRILEKAPSAELRPDQKDVDTLPAYEILDPILQAYVEEDRSPGEIASQGFDRKTVEKVIRMVDRNEYKRRQAPPGIKITPKAFGKDRRLPITNWYRH